MGKFDPTIQDPQETPFKQMPHSVLKRKDRERITWKQTKRKLNGVAPLTSNKVNLKGSRNKTGVKGACREDRGQLTKKCQWHETCVRRKRAAR